jgi:PAS domain S-box-containing protein
VSGLTIQPQDLGIGRFFERIRDAVVVADAKTQQIILWNPAATNIFGYSASEALGLRVEALVPEYLKDRHQAGIARYANTGHGPYIDSHEPLELPALTKDGEVIYVEVSLSPIESVNEVGGDGRFVLAIIREAPKRKRAEEKLRKSEERFRLLVEGVKDYAIFMLDPKGRVASWNEGAYRIKGYSQEEILGRHFSVFYTEEDVKRGHPEEELHIAAVEGTYEEEGLRVRKDRSRFWASILITALRDEGGTLRGFSKVTRDITERKQTEEKIRRLNETLEEQVTERTAQLIDQERRLKELVGKLVEAQEEERHRIAYEVHDGLTQIAVSTHQHLQAFATDHPAGSVVGPGELDQALELAQRTVKEARRLIEGLRPAALDDFGLATSLKMQIEELKKIESLQISYEDGLGGERLPDQLETALYRVAQEALTNVRKHAQTTKARIKLKRSAGKVYLEVSDGGRGFDPSAASEDSVEPGEKVGLSSMRERLSLLGGRARDPKPAGGRHPLGGRDPPTGLEGNGNRPPCELKPPHRLLPRGWSSPTTTPWPGRGCGPCWRASQTSR